MKLNRKFYIEHVEQGGPNSLAIVIADLNDEKFTEVVYFGIRDVLKQLKHQNLNYKDLQI